MSLIEAVKNNDVNKVIQLLAINKVDVREADSGCCTSLKWASYLGYKETVEILLNHDNSSEYINWQDCCGSTAIMSASYRGHKEIVELLLSHDNSSKHINHQCNSGLTPLLSASESGHKEIVELLLNYDNSVKHIEHQDIRGHTALAYASVRGYKGIIELLLEHNASFDVLDKKGESAIDLAKTDEIKELLLNWEPKNVKKAKGA